MKNKTTAKKKDPVSNKKKSLTKLTKVKKQAKDKVTNKVTNKVTKVVKRETKKQISTITPSNPVRNDQVPVKQFSKPTIKVYKNPTCLWEFRVNENAIQKETLRAFLNKFTKMWVFQKEKGETKDYSHYQGRFSLIKKKRKGELMQLFKNENLSTPNYLEPTSCNSFGLWFYVMKEETRTEGPWKNTDIKVYVPQQFLLKHKLYPYQQHILDSIKLQHQKPDRIINVIFDPKGANGKSYIAGTLASNRNAIIVPPLKSAADIVQYVCSLCVKGNIRHLPCIFFDLPRALPKADLAQMFAGIEQIKNGILYDTRYTGVQWEIESPTIWVFTNQAPDLNLLSADRWKVWEISAKKELVCYNK